MELFYQFLGEFLGTMILVILGNGVVASVSYKRMFANQAGKWIVITMAWGFAVMCGVIVSNAFNGVAHLNPAVSIFSAIANKDAMHLAFIPVQILGAMVGQVILNFINWRHIQETDLATVRGAHSTGPAFSNKEKSKLFNFSYEFVGTLILIGLILAFSKGANPAALSSMGVLPVTFLVMALGMSLGSSTGYALNPARDLGPRIVYFLMEKTVLKSRSDEHVGANWEYSWVPVVGPSAAGVVIGLFGLI